MGTLDIPLLVGFEPEIYANWVRKEELERWVKLTS